MAQSSVLQSEAADWPNLGEEARKPIRHWSELDPGLKVKKYSEKLICSYCPRRTPGFTLKMFIVHFTPSGKQNVCQHMGKETYKLSPVMKSQLSISSAADRGALVPEYPVSEESFISESVKGQVQAFDSASRPVKLHVKTAKYVHEGCPFSSSFFGGGCVWTGIWHSYGFQMGFKMLPRVYTRQWFVNCPLCPLPERPHSLPLRSVRLPSVEVNIATVLAPSPHTARSRPCAPWGHSPGGSHTLTPQCRFTGSNQSISLSSCL